MVSPDLNSNSDTQKTQESVLPNSDKQGTQVWVFPSFGTRRNCHSCCQGCCILSHQHFAQCLRDTGILVDHLVHFPLSFPFEIHHWKYHTQGCQLQHVSSPSFYFPVLSAFSNKLIRSRKQLQQARYFQLQPQSAHLHYCLFLCFGVPCYQVS